MKKKVLVFIIILLLLLIGCSNSSSDAVVTYNNTMTIIETEHTEDGTSYRIFIDKETKVMYLFMKNGYGGGLTVMLNADGSPKLYQGE